MARIETKTYYSFSELTELQQKAYFKSNRDQFEPDPYWHESALDFFTDSLNLVGFSDVKIGFSGFWSQGDGAHFIGSYEYDSQAVSKSIVNFPQFVELHKFARDLQDLNNQHGGIGFTISRGQGSNHYSHENTTSFEFSHDDGFNFSDEVAGSFTELCRNFMRHIYSSLKEEYSQLCSWEHVNQNIDLFDYIELDQYTLDSLNYL